MRCQTFGTNGQALEVVTVLKDFSTLGWPGDAEALQTPIRPLEARQFASTDARDSTMPSEAISCIEGG
jgi:hypothetical protein